MSQYRHWGMGSRGREVIVTARRSRHRVAGKGGDQKTKEGYPNPVRDADQMERLEGHEGSGSGHWATCKPAIRFVEMSHGEQE
jgi:hypothetical protein